MLLTEVEADEVAAVARSLLQGREKPSEEEGKARRRRRKGRHAVGGERVGEVAVEWGSRKGARVRPDEGDSEGLGFLSL